MLSHPLTETDEISSTSQLLQRLLKVRRNIDFMLEPARDKVKSYMRFGGYFFGTWGLCFSTYISIDPVIRGSTAYGGFLSCFMIAGVMGTSLFINSFRAKPFLLEQAVRLNLFCENKEDNVTDELDEIDLEEAKITIENYNRLDHTESKITTTSDRENHVILIHQLDKAISELKHYDQLQSEVFLSTIKKFNLFGPNIPAPVVQTTLDYLDCQNTPCFLAQHGYLKKR